jgi:hypothetical protein
MITPNIPRTKHPPDKNKNPHHTYLLPPGRPTPPPANSTPSRAPASPAHTPRRLRLEDPRAAPRGPPATPPGGLEHHLLQGHLTAARNPRPGNSHNYRAGPRRPPPPARQAMGHPPRIAPSLYLQTSDADLTCTHGARLPTSPASRGQAATGPVPPCRRPGPHVRRRRPGYPLPHLPTVTGRATNSPTIAVSSNHCSNSPARLQFPVHLPVFSLLPASLTGELCSRSFPCFFLRTATRLRPPAISLYRARVLH